MKLFDEIPYLENEHVVLRKITEDDADLLEKIASDEKVRSCLPADLFEYGFEDKKDAARNMYGDLFTEKEALYLGICLKSSPKDLIGIAECYHYDPNWNKVSISIRIASDLWGNGIAHSAAELLMEYLFEKTDIKRVTVHAKEDAERSSDFFLDLGFRMRRSGVPENWGYDRPVPVNKYIYEKWGNISYVKIGSGEKIMVMLPGLALKSTLGAASFIANSYSMFKDYSIYLFDDRSNIGENYSIRERAGDVAAEMKTLGIGGACVFGASMGGMVGQYLAIDHPELVKKLFVSSTLSKMNPQAVETLKEWRELAQTGDYEKVAEECLMKMHSESTIEKYGHLFKNSVGEVSEEELEKFIRLIDAILNVNTYDELEKIKCPVFVAASMGDRVLLPLGGEEIIEKLGCESHIYGDDYGHAVYDEAADHRDLIYNFFEQTDCE